MLVSDERGCVGNLGGLGVVLICGYNECIIRKLTKGITCAQIGGQNESDE